MMKSYMSNDRLIPSSLRQVHLRYLFQYLFLVYIKQVEKIFDFYPSWFRFEMTGTVKKTQIGGIR